MFNDFRRAGLLMGRISWPRRRCPGRGQIPWSGPVADSIMGREKPRSDPSWSGGAGEPCGDHHCGNILNCVFLRPWEAHTKVRHGKRGLGPPGGLGGEEGGGVLWGLLVGVGGGGPSCEQQPPSCWMSQRSTFARG